MEDRVIACLSIGIGLSATLCIPNSDSCIIETPEEVLFDKLSCHSGRARLDVTSLGCADIDPRVLSRVLKVEGELISIDFTGIE